MKFLIVQTIVTYIRTSNVVNTLSLSVALIKVSSEPARIF